MLLEGLAEFHQHSVWYFGVACTLDRRQSEYTFPLITPGLARTIHLFLGSLAPFHDDEPFRHRDNVNEGWEDQEEYDGSDGQRLERYFWLPQKACIDINCMTTSMEVPEGVQNVKVTITIPQDMAFPCSSVRSNIIHGQQYPSLYDFDLSQLERLAVHRGLRSFEATLEVQVHGLPFRKAEWEAAGKALDEELERVGKLLVEGGEAVRSVARPLEWQDVKVYPADYTQYCFDALYKSMVKRP
jgi:hypothetical protein